jgi:hypothetical protein
MNGKQNVIRDNSFSFSDVILRVVVGISIAIPNFDVINRRLP